MSKRTVYKYSISMIIGDWTIDVPGFIKVVHVGLDRENQPKMWVEIETDIAPNAPKINKRFKIFGTGFIIPSCWNHVGTWLDGALVWHLYELAERDEN